MSIYTDYNQMTQQRHKLALIVHKMRKTGYAITPDVAYAIEDMTSALEKLGDAQIKLGNALSDQMQANIPKQWYDHE